jgi:hypothetical protein
MQEDPGNADHNAKIWQYAINGDSLKVIAKHDPARFGDIGVTASAPFNKDEESSGIIDMEEILGPGEFIFVDQSHSANPNPALVENGQLLKLFNPDTYAAFRKEAGLAKSTNTTPYLIADKPGVKLTSLFTVGDDSVGVNNYKMAGLGDGLGAFDNGNGTFTLLMNHELGADKGVVRAHGAKGAFVSKWVINKSDLEVISGEDLMKNVYGWNNANQASEASTMTYAFQRFCSADLPAVTAFYNAGSGLGTMERIFMNGEEGGANGFAVAHVASGANEGNSYVLGKFNLSTNNSGLTAVGGWENLMACPFVQDKTVVIGTNDGGFGIMNNSVAVYVGTKTNTGTEVDKAGLNNGTLKFINVAGNTAEIVNTTTRTTNITSGTAFTLSGTAATTFSRPEDGAWDPKDPTKFYFVTTDRLDQIADGVGPQIGRSRLWRLNFNDITNPDLGGTIDLLIDGTEGVNMLDNLTIDNYGHVLMQEDPGNADHNAKIWQYAINGDSLKVIAKHDPARFGDIGVTASAPFNKDEESSGIIDMEEILGPGEFIFVDQSHSANPNPALVENGQLLKLFNPDTYAASQLITNVVKAEQSTEISLFPNPSGDAATVTFKLENNNQVVLSVFDNQGNQVISPITKTLGAGVHKFLINTSEIASGVYVVQIATSNKKSRIKAVIIH